jgi:hypothetical protein
MRSPVFYWDILPNRLTVSLVSALLVFRLCDIAKVFGPSGLKKLLGGIVLGDGMAGIYTLRLVSCGGFDDR